ncbi:MAG: regulatory protein RecX [Steroidobacteraceae bacterium]
MLRRKLHKGRGRPELSAERASDRNAAGNAAVTLLARRDFCSGELIAKLVEQGYQAEIVAEVVADLAERRLIDDERYARQFVSYHADRGHGPGRIRRDLLEIGLASVLIEMALGEDRDWAQLAREVRIRKFGLEPPADWPEKARQARFLQYRGFSTDHIRSALGASFELDSDQP